MILYNVRERERSNAWRLGSFQSWKSPRENLGLFVSPAARKPTQDSWSHVVFRVNPVLHCTGREGVVVLQALVCMPVQQICVADRHFQIQCRIDVEQVCLLSQTVMK